MVLRLVAFQAEAIHAHLEIWKRGHEGLGGFRDRGSAHRRIAVVDAQGSVRRIMFRDARGVLAAPRGCVPLGEVIESAYQARAVR